MWLFHDRKGSTRARYAIRVEEQGLKTKEDSFPIKPEDFPIKQNSRMNPIAFQY
jgi:hypothetical protein